MVVVGKLVPLCHYIIIVTALQGFNRMSATAACRKSTNAYVARFPHRVSPAGNASMIFRGACLNRVQSNTITSNVAHASKTENLLVRRQSLKCTAWSYARNLCTLEQPHCIKPVASFRLHPPFSLFSSPDTQPILIRSSCQIDIASRGRPRAVTPVDIAACCLHPLPWPTTITSSNTHTHTHTHKHT